MLDSVVAELSGPTTLAPGDAERAELPMPWLSSVMLISQTRTLIGLPCPEMLGATSSSGPVWKQLEVAPFRQAG